MTTRRTGAGSPAPAPAKRRRPAGAAARAAPPELAPDDCQSGPEISGPHGLWLVGGRLFCAADAGALVVLDRDSSNVVASLPLPGVPDVVMHDPNLRRLHVAIGEPGLVCSFDSERLEAIDAVETEEGAHTIGWDPDGRSLYVFCPASGGALVFEDNA